MKSIKIKNSILFVSLFIMILFSETAISQNTKVTWYSFNMGYSEPKSGNTLIKSVVGQTFVGITQQSNIQVISGFLADTLFRSTAVDVKNQEQLPCSYSLWQNYPNPFNPSTTIHFELPKESHVTLKVYSLLGQEVVTVLNEEKVAGRYDLRIDGTSLASSVYFYRLVAGDFIAVKKFVLLK